MKNLFLNLTFAFAAISFVAFTGVLDSKKVSTINSKVVWKGYKVTGSHEGTINLKSGDLQFENGMLKGGSFVIDMTTIKVTDTQGKAGTSLEGHLSSPDFFGVEKFPEASLTIKQVVSRGTPGDYKVVADITIKETTKEIKFMTKVSEEMGKMTATSDITIDRSDFNVRYGSGSFFEDLGDKTIYDEFELSIQLVTE